MRCRDCVPNAMVEVEVDVVDVVEVIKVEVVVVDVRELEEVVVRVE